MMTNSQTAPLVDSHCHLNMIDLSEFDNDIHQVIIRARANGVEHMLCVCVEPTDLPALYQLLVLIIIVQKQTMPVSCNSYGFVNIFVRRSLHQNL